MLQRRAAKRDTSEPAIVDALRACGFSVVRLSAKGCPDLLVGRGGITRVIEVKTGTEQLNDAQRAWWASWNSPAIILRTVEDVPRLAKYWHLTDWHLLTQLERFV
jgi:hypothetical protein